MKHLQQYEKFISLMGKMDMNDIECDLESHLSENENFELLKVQVGNHGNNLFSITITEKFPVDKFDLEYILELNRNILPHVAKECGADLQKVNICSHDIATSTAYISFYLQYPFP